MLVARPGEFLDWSEQLLNFTGTNKISPEKKELVLLTGRPGNGDLKGMKKRSEIYQVN